MKTCTKCNQTLDISRFGTIFKKKYNKTYHLGECKSCKTKYVNDWHKQFAIDNPDLHKKNRRDYYDRYYGDDSKLEMRRSAQRDNRLQNIDRYKEYFNNLRVIQTNQLHYMYIKQLLCRYGDLKHADIPDSLVKLKTEQLIIKRKLKNHE
jgi:hypothetical protein